jgi:hypothetical protein
VPVAWRTHVEEDRGIDEVIQDAEEDVPVSALRNAEPDEVEDATSDGVAHRLEGRGRDRHDLSFVVAHRGHVLDEEEGRSEYLGRPRRAQVQRIAGVRPPRVVVQVRMTLAGWPCQQEVHLTHLASDLALGSGSAGAE